VYGLGDKIMVFKFKRRKNARKQGIVKFTEFASRASARLKAGINGHRRASALRLAVTPTRGIVGSRSTAARP
jgi:hypothetical protein